jgi:hypothetical protein
MKFDYREGLKDKRVLYIVLFLAVSNLFGFLMTQNFNGIIVFLLTGLISTYFSRNMIVVMLVAMVVSNIVSGTNMFRTIQEGMENNKKKDDEESESEDEHNDDNKKEGMESKKKANKQGMTTLSPSSLDEDESSSKKLKSKPKIDYAGTLESAYDNLDNLLSSDALKNMTSDTQRLAEKQKTLMGNIKKLEPMMQKAGEMLNGLDMQGMQGMIQSLSKNMSMFNENEKEKK